MAFEGLLLPAVHSLYFQTSPRPWSQHSSLCLQHSSLPQGTASKDLLVFPGLLCSCPESKEHSSLHPTCAPGMQFG